MMVRKDLPGKASDIPAVNPDLPFLGVVETFQELDQGALCRPGHPHDGHHFSGANRKGKVPKHPILRRL